MLRNQTSNGSVDVRSTLSTGATSKTSNKSDAARIPGSYLQRTNERGSEKALQKDCGISKICPHIDEVSPETQEEEKEKRPFSEKASKALSTKVGDGDFSEPKLLTSLKVIESLNSLTDKRVQSKSQSNRESILAKKATRKVNVPFEEKVFKDLIDLQINNEDLGLTSLPVKPKEIIKVKDPEPVLSDFYQPKFNKEYVIKPTLPTFEVSTLKMPELPSIYEMTKCWEPDLL